MREKARGSEEEGKAFRRLHAEEKVLKTRRRGCWPARRTSGGLYIFGGVYKECKGYGRGGWGGVLISVLKGERDLGAKGGD